jgi:hypothetical protein
MEEMRNLIQLNGVLTCAGTLLTIQTWNASQEEEEEAQSLVVVHGSNYQDRRNSHHYQGASPKFSNFQEFVAKRHRQVRKVSCYAASLAEVNCNPSLPIESLQTSLSKQKQHQQQPKLPGSKRKPLSTWTMGKSLLKCA